jgi:hypothetical protein
LAGRFGGRRIELTAAMGRHSAQPNDWPGGLTAALVTSALFWQKCKNNPVQVGAKLV